MSQSIPISQLTPAYPRSQLQVYELTPSRQVAPFSQGAEAHSSISTEKFGYQL